MRTARRLRKQMFYSRYVESVPVYERDEDGNIVYIEIDGDMVPVEVGTTDPHYDEPKEFYASISSRLNELHANAYGVSQSNIYSEICVTKGYLPKDFTYGCRVWKDSPIIWDDVENKVPREESADYIVKGLLTEFPNYDWYLLQRNDSGDE